MNALAYTVGRDIVFGARQYAPRSSEGRRLLAHELAHAVQQNANIDAPQLQRKMALGSEKDAEAFQWFLTANDAQSFSFADKGGKLLEITMKSPASAKIDDTYRVNILQTIINNASESLLIQGFELDQKVTSHQLYKDGKLDKAGMQPTLREMSRSYLGAGGVTIPSPSLALASDPQYTGPVTGVANQSWIFYSTPTALAHEFGHAILLFSGTSWTHGGTVPKGAGVLDPEGKAYAGLVNEFIEKLVAEKYAELTLIDPDALHFSPTAIRHWPEPPHYKFTFTGTWLQFLAKYPGATVSQGEEKKKGREVKSLHVCIPKPGEICP